jgi:hypothetical protein
MSLFLNPAPWRTVWDTVLEHILNHALLKIFTNKNTKFLITARVWDKKIDKKNKTLLFLINQESNAEKKSNFQRFSLKGGKVIPQVRKSAWK